MSPVPDKTALRLRLRSLRRRLAVEIPDAAERAAAKAPVERLPPFRAFSVYFPQGAELDPRPLMHRLAATGATPALPVSGHGEAGMAFRRWDPHHELHPDAFGIPAPPRFAGAVVPDLVVAPVLGFDRRGHRLGQGAGVYDRALEKLRAARPVFVLGLAYAGQEIPELPAETHDQRLDAILTETDYIEVG